MNRRTYLTGVGLLASASVAGCVSSAPTNGSADGSGGGSKGSAAVEDPIEVDLGEWYVRPAVDVLPAGEHTFDVMNESGGETHELEIRTRKVDGGPLETIAAVEDIRAGTYKPLTVTLDPGTYEFACLMRETEENGEVEDHYRMGMHTTVRVEE